jgi:hypothetical protein
MFDFNLPIESIRISGERSPRPTLSIGPPYFYYENIECTTKDVLETTSRF